ncbi:hypothetical protein Q766_07865 [Flavobacterium subsaxonicum WB 4.1-42 = DSM 21790]|uniref:Uncharacterized protein n=2 Tax=Flavobacterium TaxID=237 RepID=A0A0A2MLP5_9FLAO|nr:hypothetical protein Q766_07865 [Flavobacterium subsaxonicum WB 4.1-42 = DSM 21790]
MLSIASFAQTPEQTQTTPTQSPATNTAAQTTATTAPAQAMSTDQAAPAQAMSTDQAAPATAANQDDKAFKKISQAEIAMDVLKPAVAKYEGFSLVEALVAEDGSQYKLVLTKDGKDVAAYFKSNGEFIKEVAA